MAGRTFASDGPCRRYPPARAILRVGRVGGRRLDGQLTKRAAPTAIAAVIGWLSVVAVSVWWGSQAISGRGLGVNAAPLAGRWDWNPRAGIAAPIAVAVAIVGWGPGAAARVRRSWVPLLAGGAATVWAGALAASDGWGSVTRPLTTRHEYEPYAATIGGAGQFLRTFVERLPDTPIHVQGHPPGATLVPWGLDGLGLPGAGWFAALVLLGWGVAVASAVVASRAIAGERAARRAAPALVLLPAAVWAGTSADGLFAGVLGAGAAMALVGGRTRRVELLLATAGGAVLGVGLLLTYGGVTIVALAVGVLLWRRRPLPAALVVAGAGVVLVAVAAASGFSWLDGLDATRARYAAGIASERPSLYFALAGNPGALALAVGPAVAVGLAAAVRHVRSARSLLPLAAMLVVLAANVSLLSKGEVERVWLLFVPWLAVAAPGSSRGWLAAQAGLALVLQTWLVGKW